MGASCSGTKAAQVTDSVNKVTLNTQAKEHLKSLNPNTTLGKISKNIHNLWPKHFAKIIDS